MMIATYGNRYGRVLYERTMIATSVITYEVGKNTGFDTAGVPGGLVGGPCAYQDQFGGFKSHRVHDRGFFL